MTAWFFKRKSQTNKLWDSMSSASKMVATIRRGGSAISPRRQAGIIFKPDDGNSFMANLEEHLNNILHVGEGATKTGFDLADDDHGMRWVILDDGNFTDLLSSVYTVSNAIQHNGVRGNLLAAVFNFDFAGKAVATESADNPRFLQSYLIFRFDRNSYYPFIPTGVKEGDRDREREKELGASMRNHGLNLERSFSEWLGLWGIPF